MARNNSLIICFAILMLFVFLLPLVAETKVNRNDISSMLGLIGFQHSFYADNKPKSRNSFTTENKGGSK